MSVAIVDPTTGDTIRRMERDVEPGWQQLQWRGDTDGVRWPSRELDNNDEPRGGGAMAAPGDYNAILTFGDHVGTMQLTWSDDPRTTFDGAAYASGKAHRKRVDAEVERLAGLMQELAVAEETMKAMASVWSLLDNTEDVDSLQADMSEGIKDIHEMLWTPKDFVGYDHVTVRVMDELYQAMPDLHEGATATDERQLQRVKAAIDEVEAEVEALMADTWAALKGAAESLPLTLEEVMEGVRSAED